jgi:transcriptional repressor NrdR
MRCPFCGASEDKVIETRVSRDGLEIRRRRECVACGRRFTTYERIEESMPLVVKADGRREPFDRAKIEHGIRAAVAKRPVSRDQIAALALEVEREVSELGVTEVASRGVGERVLARLRALDQVAYVRFASIYRDFRDLEGFAKELDALRGDDTGRHEPALRGPGTAEIDAEDPTSELAPAVELAEPAGRAAGDAAPRVLGSRGP